MSREETASMAARFRKSQLATHEVLRVGGPGTFPEALCEVAARVASVCVLQLRFFEREDAEVKEEEKEEAENYHRQEIASG